MTAFAFDPYAMLEKIRNGEGTPAKVATPATERSPAVETVATLAGLAGVPSENENPDRVAETGSDCLISDLFERIGLMDETGGQAVYDAAARDLGYADFDAAVGATMAGWKERLRDCRHPAVSDALENWHWCEIAARHGWCAQSLWGCFSGLIPRLKGGSIRDVYRDYVVMADGAMLMRCPRHDDPLIWQEK